MNVSSVSLTNNSRLISPVEVLDYMPMVSIASGAARMTFGSLQTIAAPIQDVVSFVNFCFHPSQNLNIDNDTTSLSLRGKANMIRGSIAMCPIVGNIAIYLFDHSSVAKGWEFRVARSLEWAI